MPTTDITSPARGAYLSLTELIAQRLIARQLELRKQTRALSHLAGPNKTNFRGRGIDFEEVRLYQPGDDIRTIDWRVTARTGDAHTKLFREERERPVLIVVDQRSTMFFGSQHCFKSVLAGHLASLLAWSALQAGDRVGGLVFNELGHQEIRPKRNRKTVLALLSQITEYNSVLPLNEGVQEKSFSDLLSKLRRIARPGSSLFIVSDFKGAATQAAQEQLFELAKHTEITAIACHDPLETQLPQAGLYAVTNGRDRSELSTADRSLRKRFEQQQQEHAEQLSNSLLRLGIPLLQACTDESPFGLLQRYYQGSRR